LELVEPGVRVVLALDARGPLELGDDRMERALRVVRGAEVAQAGMPLAMHGILERGRQPRLADAGLAGNKHHPPLAALLDLGPAPPQQVDLLLAANQAGAARAQRLEAARHAALRQDLAGTGLLGAALQLRGVELAIVEQAAEQVPRAARDHHGPRRCKACQARGEKRRCADGGGLRCRSIAALAEHDETRRDADARRQRLDEALDAQRAHGPAHLETRPNRPLGILLVRLRIAEIGNDPVLRAFGDRAAVLRHHVPDAPVAGCHDLAKVLGVEAGRKAHGVRHAAGHDGELPPLRRSRPDHRCGRFTPCSRLLGAGLRRRLLLPHLADEAMALAGDRADQPLLIAAVADRLPHCRDPAAQRRFRDDAAVPHLGDQVVFAHHAGAVADQEQQEVEDLRLDAILAFDPFFFAARAYEHFRASADGCAQLQALLAGDAAFIWVRGPSR
jgi:hypothetical protein